MSLETRLRDLSVRIATEFKTVRLEMGALGAGDLLAANNLSDLASAATARTNLSVLSTAEVNALVAAITLASLGGLTQLQVDARAQAILDASIGAAPGTLDTIQELADALQDNPDIITDILTSLGNRVRFDAAQGLSAPQLLQVQTNINVLDASNFGNPDYNLVTEFETALL